MKLINADKLQEEMYHEAFETDTDMQKWDSGCWIRYKMFENILDKQEIIEADVDYDITSIIIDGKVYDKVRYGIWTHRGEAIIGNPYGHYECNICGNRMPHKTQYCCYCGAKMDIGEEE